MAGDGLRPSRGGGLWRGAGSADAGAGRCDALHGGVCMIKCISGWWYLVNAGAFHGYPFPTRADAAEALEALQAQEQA